MQYYHAGDYDAAVIGAGTPESKPRWLWRGWACAPSFYAEYGRGGEYALQPVDRRDGKKGHLVSEIDALGGEMGLAADETFIQSRMLNRGKGPGRPLPARADRPAQHQMRMKRVLEQTENLPCARARSRRWSWMKTAASAPR